MRPVPDKELDGLFRQGLENLTIEPSAAVWQRVKPAVVKEAHAASAMRFYWIAAASLAVIVAAGVVWQRPQKVIRLQGQIAAKEISKPVREINITHAPAADRVRRTDEPLISACPLPAIENELIEEPVNEMAERQPGPKLNVREVVAIPAKELKQDPVVAEPTAQVMLAEISEDTNSNSGDSDQEEPRKIKNIGGLVNFVISKVDRRDDKLIEFSDGEEGPEVSGINLGLLKLKKRQ